MKCLILLYWIFCIVQYGASLKFGNLGIFGRFKTTLAPIDNSDPTLCREQPRKWGLCQGTSNPKRSTTDACQRVTEKCSRGTLQASHFMASVLSDQVEMYWNSPPSPPTGNVRCRRFTHNHEYIEENQKQNRPKRFSSFGNVTVMNRPLGRWPFLRESGGPMIFRDALAGCTRRKKRQAFLGQANRDIAILMDESGSVGEANFNKMKRIASAFIRLLCGVQSVAPDKTRISITSFDSQVHHHKNLTASSSRLNNDASYLAGFIDHRINYNSLTHGKTCIAKALDFVRETALNSNGARRGETGVIQEVLLLTDGCENCIAKSSIAVADAAERLEKADIDVYVIGIKLHRVCQEQLDILARGGKCFHFFNIVDWRTDLDDFISGIEKPPPGFCLTQLYNDRRSTCANPPFG